MPKKKKGKGEGRAVAKRSHIPAPASHTTIDYSRFDRIASESSDEEAHSDDLSSVVALPRCCCDQHFCSKCGAHCNGNEEREEEGEQEEELERPVEELVQTDRSPEKGHISAAAKPAFRTGFFNLCKPSKPGRPVSGASAEATEESLPDLQPLSDLSEPDSPPKSASRSSSSENGGGPTLSTQEAGGTSTLEAKGAALFQQPGLTPDLFDANGRCDAEETLDAAVGIEAEMKPHWQLRQSIEDVLKEEVALCKAGFETEYSQEDQFDAHLDAAAIQRMQSFFQDADGDWELNRAPPVKASSKASTPTKAAGNSSRQAKGNASATEAAAAGVTARATAKQVPRHEEGSEQPSEPREMRGFLASKPPLPSTRQEPKAFEHRDFSPQSSCTPPQLAKAPPQPSKKLPQALGKDQQACAPKLDDGNAQKARQKRAQKGSRGSDRAQEELERAYEVYTKALLEEEDKQKRNSEKSKAQEARNTSTHEKRKAKAKRKKQKLNQSRPKSGKEQGSAAWKTVEEDSADGEEAESAAEESNAFREAAEPQKQSVNHHEQTKEESEASEQFVEEIGLHDDDDDEGVITDQGEEADSGGGSSSNNPFEVLLNPGKVKVKVPARPVSAASSGRQVAASPTDVQKTALQRPVPTTRQPSPHTSRAVKQTATPLPPLNGFATSEQSKEVEKVWSSMGEALRSEVPKQLASAVRMATEWLAKTNNSKVFLGVNQKLKERLGRAQELLPRHHHRGPPPPLLHHRVLPSHRPYAPVQHIQRQHIRPSGGLRPPWNPALDPGIDPADPFGGVPMGGRTAQPVHRPPPPPPVVPRYNPPMAAFIHLPRAAHCKKAPPPLISEALRPAYKPQSHLPKPGSLDARALAAPAVGEDDELMCIVCMDWPAEVVLQPCGHGNMCWECAAKVKKYKEGLCPSCRIPIEEVVVPAC